jgi:hypothetical protein
MKNRKGTKHNCWQGGKIMDGAGYVRIYCPEDPRANQGRYMREHQVVMEKMIGRQLLPGESVHHKNGVRHDNRPENLELWVTSQPSGQRTADLVVWAKEILQKYENLGTDDRQPENVK